MDLMLDHLTLIALFPRDIGDAGQRQINALEIPLVLSNRAERVADEYHERLRRVLFAISDRAGSQTSLKLCLQVNDGGMSGIHTQFWNWMNRHTNPIYNGIVVADLQRMNPVFLTNLWNYWIKWLGKYFWEKTGAMDYPDPLNCVEFARLNWVFEFVPPLSFFDPQLDTAATTNWSQLLDNKFAKFAVEEKRRRARIALAATRTRVQPNRGVKPVGITKRRQQMSIGKKRRRR